MASGTAAVTPAAVSVVVAGVFPGTGSAYQVFVTPSWSTGADVPAATKTALAFTVEFTVPAPADATIDYLTLEAGSVPPPDPSSMYSTLGQYLDKLRLLLHDTTDQIWPEIVKVDFINEAMRQRDTDCQINRVLQSFTLEAARSTYEFSELDNPDIFDVTSIALIYGSTRYILNQASYVMLTRDTRQWTQYRGLTQAWAKYGAKSVVFGPTPSLAYVTEWDCSTVSTPLAESDDLDPMPYPYTTPVPYFAAYWAKMNERRYPDADRFLMLYQQKINNVIGARTGLMPSVYPTPAGSPR